METLEGSLTAGLRFRLRQGHVAHAGRQDTRARIYARSARAASHTSRLATVIHREMMCSRLWTQREAVEDYADAVSRFTGDGIIREVAERRDRMGYRRETLGCSSRPHSARLKASGIRRGSLLGLGPLFFREAIDHVGEPMIPAAAPAAGLERRLQRANGTDRHRVRRVRILLYAIRTARKGTNLLVGRNNAALLRGGRYLTQSPVDKRRSAILNRTPRTKRLLPGDNGSGTVRGS